MNITTVILCGGSGTWLWPQSRRSFLKQFAMLLQDVLLFQATALRFSGDGCTAPNAGTGSDLRFVATNQFSIVGICEATVLVEPMARNTPPAVLAAALWQAKADPDCLLLFAPSDHVIPDNDGFRAAISRGVEKADTGSIITLVITPGRPQTGCSYLELSGTSTGEAVALKHFVEEHDAETVAMIQEAGTYLWNAGISVFTARAMIEAVAKYASGLLSPVHTAVTETEWDLDFFRLAADPWVRHRSTQWKRISRFCS